jgi:superkiller protein 3
MELPREQWLHFVDDELVNRPLAHDTGVVSTKKRPGAWPGLGEALRLYERGEVDAAFDCLTPALTAGDPDAHLLAAQIRVEAGRFEDALLEYRRFAELCPENRFTSFNEGLCLLAARDFGTAVDCFERSAVRDPDRWEVWFSLGIALVHQRRGSEAEACFKHVLRLNPEYVPALAAQAAALQIANCHADALAIYERLLEHDPEQPELLANALSSALATRHDQTTSLATRLLAVSPSNLQALIALAGVALDKRLFSEAIRYSSEIAKLDPTLAQNWYNLGECYRRTGRHAEAVQAFEHAIEREPHDLEALEAKARSLTVLGRTAEAQRDWESLLEVIPGNAEAWFQLGLLRFEASEWSAAAAAFEKCVVLKTQWPAQAWLNLGCCQWRLGEWQAAFQSLRSAIAHDPADANVRTVAAGYLAARARAAIRV